MVLKSDHLDGLFCTARRKLIASGGMVRAIPAHGGVLMHEAAT
ncbi:hypothetical protein [Streptomyces ehimensis]|uniref:Uncharacterized protein n=1 Tax=Streptomyces ehimensis TaxID=68195 RepID=A0ABV9BX80_9ACTN